MEPADDNGDLEDGDDARKRMSLNTISRVVAPPPREPPKPLLRTLEVRMVEVNRLTDINIISQRFQAEVVIQMAFAGGNLDADLIKTSAEFPFDGFGRPTFRPSAAWYMAQVDFNNALAYKTLDAKIVPEGNDLLLNYRFEGTFSEVMEMEEFPFDVQDLTMSLAFNTRTAGMMPLEITLGNNLSTGIMEDGFVDGNLWNLNDELDVRPGTVGRHVDRMFPSCEFVMLVGRQPTFFLLNIALPVFFFVPMAMLQFCVTRETTADRLSVSLAIVLTAVAHKYSMTSLVPAISYLTLLDKYVLASLLIVVIITFQSALIGSLEAFYCRTQAVWDDPDAEDSSTARKLVGSRTDTTNTPISLAPIYGYTDPDCPVNKNGPFNKFDYIDGACLLFDIVLYLLLQIWAARRCITTRFTFANRIEAIRLASQKRVAEDSHRRAATERQAVAIRAAAEKKATQQNPKKSVLTAATPASQTAALKPEIKRSKTAKIMSRMPSKPDVVGPCDEVTEQSEAGGMEATSRMAQPPLRKAPALWGGLSPTRVLAAAPQADFRAIAAAARARAGDNDPGAHVNSPLPPISSTHSNGAAPPLTLAT